MKIIGDGGHAKVVKTLVEWNKFEKYICAIGDNKARKSCVEQNKEYEWSIATDNKFFWRDDVEIGEGTVIMAGAIIQPGARIGKHCIINTGATVDHDCILEGYVHIAPGAHLCGNVTVGEGALIGVGVGIEPGVTIPAWSIVKREKYVITLQDH